VTGGLIGTPSGNTGTVTGTITPAYSVDFGALGIDVNAIGTATNAFQLSDPSSTMFRSGGIGVGGAAALTLKGDSGYSGFMAEAFYTHLFALGNPSSGTPSADVNRYGFNVGGFHNFRVGERDLLFFGITGGVSWESGTIHDPASTPGGALPDPRSYNAPTVNISATLGWSFW